MSRSNWTTIACGIVLAGLVWGCGSESEENGPHEATAAADSHDGHVHDGDDEHAHEHAAGEAGNATEHEDHAHEGGEDHADRDAASHDESSHAADPGHDDHTGDDGHTDHGGDSHGSSGREGAHEDHADEEMLVTLAADVIAASRIEIAVAGSRDLHLGIDLPGEVVPNADRVAHVVPRFPGIAKEVRKSLGDRVAQDEVLAIVESNESLAPYEVRSLIAGTVIEKHIALGEFVRDEEDIFIVADLSTVWVNITIYARDLDKIKQGQRVDISVVGDGPRAASRIDYVGPALGEITRTASARAVLPNPTMEWRPGMFVTAHVAFEEPIVPVAVPDAALQRIAGTDVVFVEESAGRFRARPVAIGRRDGDWTEIEAGLSAGERYVERGGFLLKSELMKSEASHQH